ncbi:MAG: transcription termination factor NusA [Candidatus Sumerlaeota bacterium]|nr:transcription termination factor NusA [Candidatus Sumerlaeota bacterium]
MPVSNQTLLGFIQQISKEKGLNPQIIKEAVEQAVVATSKKNLSQFINARAELNMETGELQVLVTKKIVETVSNWRSEVSLKEARKISKSLEIGGEAEVPIPASDFGRIAAQSARQIIMQKIRDAEREKIFEEYKDRVGQIVTGVIQRFERRDAVVNIGDTEAILPYEEQPIGVHYKFGDRIKCLIQNVEMTPRGPHIRISRACPELIEKMFALEVPEIGDGVVRIVNIAREAGVRTKLAVSSRNPDVDPVGACVGMKGSRVQMIVREFENEKIDIVPFSADPVRYIIAALNPAQIQRVDLSPEKQRAMVVVPKDSLSLAIGKRGQNARLAAKLTGWQLDIKSAEEEAEEEAVEEARIHYLNDLLEQVEMAAETRQAIAASAYNSVEALAEAEPADLMALVGGSEELADLICGNARSYVEALQAMQAAQEADEAKAAAEQATAAQATAGEGVTPAAETSAPGANDTPKSSQ